MGKRNKPLPSSNALPRSWGANVDVACSQGSIHGDEATVTPHKLDKTNAVGLGQNNRCGPPSPRLFPMQLTASESRYPLPQRTFASGSSWPTYSHFMTVWNNDKHMPIEEQLFGASDAELTALAASVQAVSKPKVWSTMGTSLSEKNIWPALFSKFVS